LSACATRNIALALRRPMRRSALKRYRKKRSREQWRSITDELHAGVSLTTSGLKEAEEVVDHLLVGLIGNGLGQRIELVEQYRELQLIECRVAVGVDAAQAGVRGLGTAPELRTPKMPPRFTLGAFSS